MTIDDAMVMAYADGELGPIEAKRIERAAALDPSLAERIAAQRALRSRIADAFAPVALEPVPDRLAAMLNGNVVPLPVRRAPVARWWPAAGAVAAALALTIGLSSWQRDTASGGLADARLGRALDRQLASTSGDPRMLVSFRNHDGDYCRVFEGRAAGGIACRADDSWRLVLTRRGTATSGADYRQAGSADATLLAEAQTMMAGDPLDAAAEAQARRQGWH